MTLDRACEIAMQLRAGQKPALWTDQREALDTLIGAAKIAERLMARQQAVDDLVESIEFDNTAGVDEQAQSVPVLGNVSIATLRALGLGVPEGPKPKRFDVDAHFAYEYTAMTEEEAKQMALKGLRLDIAKGWGVGEVKVKEVE